MPLFRSEYSIHIGNDIVTKIPVMNLGLVCSIDRHIKSSLKVPFNKNRCMPSMINQRFSLN